jgi:hypothetical protein
MKIAFRKHSFRVMMAEHGRLTFPSSGISTTNTHVQYDEHPNIHIEKPVSDNSTNRSESKLFTDHDVKADGGSGSKWSHIPNSGIR